MPVFSIARRTTNVTNTEASMDVMGSTGLRPRVLEWTITLGAATASTYGLFRATAAGTRTTPVALLPEDAADPAPTGTTLLDSAIAHSVQPTLASDALRRVGLPATIGAGRTWIFPKGIVLAATPLSLVLENLATNGVLDSEVVVEQ